MVSSFFNTIQNAIISILERLSVKSAKRLGLVFIATILAVGVWSAIAIPALAYQVQILPASPVRGDTISVIIRAENESEAPTVTVGSETYPSFLLSGNRYRAFIPTSPNTKPGNLTLQISGTEGSENVTVNIGARNFPTQYITLSGATADLEGTDYEFDRLDALRALRTPERYWNGPMGRPSTGYVSSTYGLQRYYNGVFAEDYYHRGVDYAAGTGSPIYAPAAGKIIVVGRVEDGFELNGNTIGIDHGQGVTSVMIHLSGFAVKEGDIVQKGQLIGYMGATGSASGPNLHWGLFVNGISVDPVPWRYDEIE